MKTKPITQPINPKEPHRYVGKNGIELKAACINSLNRPPVYFGLYFKDGTWCQCGKFGNIIEPDFYAGKYDLLEIVEDAPKTIPINMDWLLKELQKIAVDNIRINTDKTYWYDGNNFIDKAKTVVCEALEITEKEGDKDRKYTTLQIPHDLGAYRYTITNREGIVLSTHTLTENVDGVPDEKFPQSVENHLAAIKESNQNRTSRNMGWLANEVYNRLLYPNLSSTEGARKKIGEVVEFIRGYDPNGSIPELPITFNDYVNKILSPAIEQTRQSQKLKQSVHRLRCMAERLEYDDYYYTEDFEREAEAILRGVSNG